MDRPLFTIVLIAWAHLCWACDVEQSPSLLVTLSKELSSINCRVSLTTNLQPQDIKTSVFFKGEPAIPLDGKTSGMSGTPTRTSIQYNVATKKSGVYICQVTCGTETKEAVNGTYIYVRDYGYEEPIGPAGSLQCGMIVLLVLLLLLSVSGTYLVLPFHQKKQRRPSKSSSAPSAPETIPQPTTQQPEAETSGSLYTSLQRRSDDVYDVLDEDISRKTSVSQQRDSDNMYDVLGEGIPRKTSVKLHAEIHGVPSLSSLKKPKPQPKTAPLPEKTPAAPDRPPTKQKPKEVMADNSLYENVKR